MNPIVVQYGTGSTQSLIEGWSSLIWTERFREAGEFELRTPRVAEHFTQMPEGAAISLLDSREVMLVDTHTIEKNEKGESELVIAVTPHLAKPMRPEELRLPTDSFIEPSDRDFYLMGRMEGKKPKSKDSTAQAGGTESEFGQQVQ